MALAGHFCSFSGSKQELHLFNRLEVSNARSIARSQRRRGNGRAKSFVVHVQRSEAYRSTGWEHGAGIKRRNILLGMMFVAASSFSAVAATAEDAVPVDIDVLASYAMQAYNEKDLKRAREYFNKIVARDPNPVWLERRGQVLVDMKAFAEALDDFSMAEKLYRYDFHSTPFRCAAHTSNSVFLTHVLNPACLLTDSSSVVSLEIALQCQGCTR